MNIWVIFRADFHNGEPCPAYPWSFVEAFSAMRHKVFTCGEGHPVSDPEGFPRPDLVVEIENGRNADGGLRFQHAEKRYPGQSAVVLYDTHGRPHLHGLIAPRYDHVFFGSWCKRDVFAGHKSAHWCPSATDLKWFGADRFSHIHPEVDVGFFGSKKGLERAKTLVEICKHRGWSYDVRQIGRPSNPNRWPATGEAMARCRVLFNQGQKHDSPNLRCVESMAVGRPLVTNLDPESGMSRLFQHHVHYLNYSDLDYMESAMDCALGEKAAKILVNAAYAEVSKKHLVVHRARQILEVMTT